MGTLDESTKAFMATVEEARFFAVHFKRGLEVDKYFDMVNSSLNSWLDSIVKRTRYVDRKLPQYTVTARSYSALLADARVSLNGSGGPHIEVSHGLYLALQDIVLRAVSSENFFNTMSGDAANYGASTHGWGGALCIQPLLIARPKLRYVDYRPQDLDADLHDMWLDYHELQKARGHPPISDSDATNIPLWASGLLPISDSGATASPSWVGRVVRKLPDDSGRLTMAAMLLDMCLTWILLHEESHWTQGHFQYIASLNTKDKHLGTAAQDSTPLSMHETSSRPRHYGEEASRVFEWQADRAASWGLRDVFFHESLKEMLPPYALPREMWMLRALMTAVGLVALVMDRTRRQYGQSSGYPSPLCRWMSASRIIVSTWMMRAHPNGVEWGSNHLRMAIGAIAQSLWDVAMVRQIVESEDECKEADVAGEWPVKDWEPGVIADILYFSGTTMWQDDEWRRTYLEDTASARLAVMGHWSVDKTQIDGVVRRTERQVGEVNKLVRLHDSIYWPLLRKWRHWER
jgi:hypothetical protein